MIGRKKPYTEAEIMRQRCPCLRRASHQWNCCAIGNRWVPVCDDCDIGLNEMVLAFFRVPDRAALLTKYRNTRNA